MAAGGAANVSLLFSSAAAGCVEVGSPAALSFSCCLGGSEAGGSEAGSVDFFSSELLFSSLDFFSSTGAEVFELASSSEAAAGFVGLAATGAS